MYHFFNKLINVLFKILLFTIPLVLWIYNSELFEFNKTVVLYVMSLLIFGAWIAKSIAVKKIIYRKNILLIPALIFLASQLISALVSIDPRTSWLGYYSRFNGGISTTVCYLFLFFAYISNVEKEENKINIKFLLASGLLVSIYGILQKFGIDKDVWVQDVQERIFSTLGQPNWLGTWISMLIPLTYLFFNKGNKITVFIISTIFFATLLFTKSRSALLGFGLASIVLFLSTFLGKEIKNNFTKLLGFFIPFVILIIIFGTPITPSVFSLGKPAVNTPKNVPVLESGGTESGEIRKIVWQGAVEIWKHYPIVGTGVETFAYSYYKYRPLAHNLVSEWDFLYNKAHNEYLNIMANTGALGLISYLFFLGASLYFMYRSKNENKWIYISGYVSVLVSNAFGFSVVPVNLVFFLLPAFCLAGIVEQKEIKKEFKVGLNLKMLAVGIWLIIFGLLFLIVKYWYADTLYAMGKSYNDSSDFIQGRKYLINAVKLSPNEAIYWSELSQSSAGIASKFHESGEDLSAREIAGYSLKEIDIAENLSPRNLNIRRDKYFVLLKLLPIDNNLLEIIKNDLLDAINLAPTDAKLYYYLALTYMRAGEDQKSMELLKNTIELKPNYKDARLAYAILLGEAGKKKEAVEELNYILKNIDSKDEFVKQELNKYAK